MKLMELKDFKYNPILKEMLKNYCLRTYEEFAVLDDEHLIMEYDFLVLSNNLQVLFHEEYLINYLNDGEDCG